MAGKLIDWNVVNEIHQPDGTVVRQFPVTKLENIIDVDKLTGIQIKALKLLAVNSYIVDDTTGKTYKIGMENGKVYFTESDVSVMDILNTITEVITPVEPTELEEDNPA